MLKEFQVKNFKNFNENFVFNLTDTKNYGFNPECVANNIVAKGMIYGPNGCGKSNLGYAIFDIQTHLKDSNTDDFYRTNYLNADSEDELAEFSYCFQSGDSVLEYRYGKRAVDQIVYETVTINGKNVISIDRQKSDMAEVDLKGAETLNRDLSQNKISVVKYVKSNTVLAKDCVINQTLKSFISFIDDMKFIQTINSHKRSVGNAFFLGIVFGIDPQELKEFETFLNDAGVKCQLDIIDINGEEKLVFKHKSKSIDFFKSASTGTLALCGLYCDISNLKAQILSNQVTHYDTYTDIYRDNISDTIPTHLPFIFIDEFDAFYHHAVSKLIVNEIKKLNCQAIFTTHNTSIMSNDLLRPDCYFIMDETSIQPTHRFTDKELRKAHNIEKMYRAGAFSE